MKQTRFKLYDRALLIRIKSLYISYFSLTSCCAGGSFLACTSPPRNFYGKKDAASLCEQIRQRNSTAVHSSLKQEKYLALSHEKDAFNAMLVARNKFPEILPILFRYQFDQLQRLLRESKHELPSELVSCIASYALGGWEPRKTTSLSSYTSLDWAIIRKDHTEIAVLINKKNIPPIAPSYLQTAYTLGDKKACELLLPYTSSPLLGKLNGHNGSIRSLLFTPTGQLATGSEDGTVKIWDIHKVSCEATFTTAATMISSIAYHSQRERIAVASWYNNDIEIWNTRHQQRVQTLQQSDTPVVSLSFCPSRSLLLLGNMGGGVKWIDTEKRSCLGSKALHEQPVMSVSWKGPQLAATGGMDGSVRLIDFRQKEVLLTSLNRGRKTAVNAVLFLPNTPYLAVGGTEKYFSIWDMRKLFNKLYDLDSGGGAVMSFAFYTPKGILACGASERAKITTWKPAAGKLLNTFGQEEGGIYNIAFHPTDNILAVGGWKANVALYGV